MTEFGTHPETERVQVEDVPDEVIEQVVEQKVRLCTCPECGNEQHHIQTHGVNVQFECEQCDEQLVI